MQSKAATVEQYLDELPPDRRLAVQAVRRVILDNLDKDIQEGMQSGMIGYYVPHRIFPAGYHCDPRQPLPFAGLASQKNYMSLYLMSVYGEGSQEGWFRAAWAKTGKKLDMGKCCIRFKKLDDLALDVIGEAIRRVPVRKHIADYQAAMQQNAANKPARKAAAKKPRTAKAAATKRSAKAPRAKRPAAKRRSR